MQVNYRTVTRCYMSPVKMWQGPGITAPHFCWEGWQSVSVWHYCHVVPWWACDEHPRSGSDKVPLFKVTFVCFITLRIPKREAGKPGMISVQFANIYSCVQSDCGVCRAYASIALGKPCFNSKKRHVVGAFGMENLIPSPSWCGGVRLVVKSCFFD